jgi:16S rRNA processing protein RimM
VPDGIVALGEIVTTHGIAGWLKLNPYNFESPLLSTLSDVILVKDETRTAVQVESARPHRRQILLKLCGIDDIESARQWVRSTLSVPEEALATPAPGQYYHYQVIGLEVFDTNGARIGTLKEIWSTPACELYVVAGVDKEHLIPAVKEIIAEVDLAAGRMIVDPPAGLLDL